MAESSIKCHQGYDEFTVMIPELMELAGTLVWGNCRYPTSEVSEQAGLAAQSRWINHSTAQSTTMPTCVCIQNCGLTIGFQFRHLTYVPQTRIAPTSSPSCRAYPVAAQDQYDDVTLHSWAGDCLA